MPTEQNIVIFHQEGHSFSQAPNYHISDLERNICIVQETRHTIYTMSKAHHLGLFFNTLSPLQTSLQCRGVGQFQCPMVVTMRPVPEEKLDLVAQITHLTPLAHGGPIHIGDPGTQLQMSPLFVENQKAFSSNLHPV